VGDPVLADPIEVANREVYRRGVSMPTRTMADLWSLKIHPMLAVLAEEPFDSEDHVFELKWDGTRALCFVDGDSRRFQNRRLYDTTDRYPELDVHTRGRAILDGEIVLMRGGKPSFLALQEREHLTKPLDIRLMSRQSPATYVAFDILYLDGRDLTSLPLTERRRILADTVDPGGTVTISEPIEREGRAFFRSVLAQGLEGIIAKQKTGRYQIGTRSRDWLKIKKRTTLPCVVAGLTQGEGNRADTFGSLILGMYDQGTLRYVGRVGTGFDDATRREILSRCKALQDARPFAEAPDMVEPVAFWMRPGLVADVHFLEMTRDGMLRAPSFGRLRLDLEPDAALFRPPSSEG